MAEKKCKLGEEKRLAARKEAKKLLSTDFIQEAHYTTWLANVVMVTKVNSKCKMCEDYTNLNKAWPNDSYLFPSNDQLIDGVADHKILSFMGKCRTMPKMRSHQNVKINK